MRFRILLLVLGLLAAMKAQAVLVTATISITNTPATSNAWTVNADARYWTNAQTATTILTNSTGIAPSLTNLLSQIDLKPYLNLQHAWLTTTQLTLKGSAVSVTFSGGGWATVSYQTNQGPVTYALLVPPTNVTTTVTAAVRTNNANYIADYLNLYGTTPLNTNAAFGSNYVTANPVPQSFGNKTCTNCLEDGSRETNIVGWNGTFYRGTNGYFTNTTLDLPKTTNLVNYGNAISSRGTGTSSENFGAGSLASKDKSTAVGTSAAASGTNSTAVGAFSVVSAYYGAAFGYGAEVDAGADNGLAAGTSSAVTAPNGTALGTLTTVTHSNSTVIGYGVSSTASNQVRIGKSGITTAIGGLLIPEAGITNTTIGGTNQWTGDVAYPWYDLNTIAAGNNLAVPLGTNTQVMLSGNGAAATIVGFTGGRDGRPVRLYNKSAYAITLAQNTSDPTPANRIVANVAGDWAFQPGEYWQIVWIPTDSRWHLEIATAAGTNYITTGQNQTNFNVWPAGTTGPAITINGLASQTHPVLTVVSNGVTNLTVHANGNLLVQNVTNVNQIASGWQQVAGNTTNRGQQSLWIASSNVTVTASNTTAVPLIANGVTDGGTNIAEFWGQGTAPKLLGAVGSNGVVMLQISNSATLYPACYRIFSQTVDYLGNTNITTATNTFFGAGQGSLALLANFWQVGRSIEIKIRGYHWTPAAPGVSLFMVNANVGTTPNTLATSLYTPQASAVGESWEADFTLTCRTNSSIGFIQALGDVHGIGNASDAGRSKPIKQTGLIFDTTQAMTIDVASTNGAATIGYKTANATAILIP